MCGFAVAIDWDCAEAVVRQMTLGIQHRGDTTDPVFSPRADIAMCTRRLRIVDRDRATQPQLSFDGKLAVSFNGEIYNHAALRREMEALGVPFKTESDTEVLANALRLWGARALTRLNGMYAFVAIEPDTGEFLGARDPFGVKPLYVVQTQTGFLFCSEIRPLLGVTETQDVLLLPPSHLVTRKTCARYKTLRDVPNSELLQSSPAVLDRLLAEAVATRIPSDMPFATMLSGGIDSTLIAHYTRRHRPEAPGYFLGGTDSVDYAFALRYAEMSGIDLRIVPFDGDAPGTLSLIDTVIEATEAFDPAVIRPGVCSFLLSQRIHDDGYRVVLCGEGADELFCGYAPMELIFADGNDAGRPAREELLGTMNRIVLQRVDRCAMRFSIETRQPFLDPSIADYALNLDASALVRTIDGSPRGKMPLRTLYDLYPDQLPAMIRDRSKVQFNDGAGLNSTGRESAWKTHFEAAISARELEDGKREFAGFDIRSKEQLYCLRSLSRIMDVSRVPHLKASAGVSFLTPEHLEKFEEYAVAAA
jgi:asparagine synthase (glutamine-hydrolysing)